MLVVKVLNNSLVLALDDNGSEIVLMGKGIGFNLKIGNKIDKSIVEKLFVLKDKNIKKNIIKLAAEIDQIYFEIVEKIIEYALGKYNLELLDHIYLSLTDHISFAVKRYENNIFIPNFYTVEMKKFNPLEYDIGLFALEKIKEKLNYDLPKDEAGNIAFHFINAQFDHPYNEKNRKIKSIVDDILEIVKYHFNINYNIEDFSYSRYIIHLRFFAQRILDNNFLNDDSSAILYEQMVEKFEKELECVNKIAIYINNRFNIKINNSESIYLALHINRILG